MTRRARIAILVAALGALQAAAVGVYLAVERSRRPAPAPFAAQPLAEAAPVPPLLATRADGSAVPLTWPAPRPRLLHFWATWCPPCRDELPSLLAFGREHRRDLEVLAIAVDDHWPDIRAFFADLGAGAEPSAAAGAIPSEILVEPAATTHKRLGVSALPDTYLIDRDGRLLERYFGARDWASPAARQRVLSHLPRLPP